MKKKSILICAENLDIGGVETAIFNDAISLKRKGHDVIIVGENGVYSEKLNEYGIEIINFKVEFDNCINMDKIQEVINIIDKYEIEEMHIHKFICVSVFMPAALLAGIPYIVHIHEALPQSYDWVINQHNIYQRLLEIYFENAYKIIAITESVKRYNMERFNIPSNKYVVINNSIDFDLFNTEKSSKNSETEIQNKEGNVSKKFLLITRVSHDKRTSINNAIEFFVEYCNKCKSTDSQLNIVGDGNDLENLRNDVLNEKKEFKINFLGGSSDIPKLVSSHDIILGMGRGIIEAMAMKKPAIISSYDNMKEMITIENIEDALFENFSGRGLERVEIDKLINKINNLKSEEIQNIVEENYIFIKDKLDINKNIYWIDDVELNNTTYSSELIYKLFTFISEVQYRYIEEKDKADEIWKAKEWFEEQLKRKEDIILQLETKIEKQTEDSRLVNKIKSKLKNK